MYVKGTVSPMPGFAGLRGRGLGRLRGRVRVLGCSSCSAKKLGQDSSIYDIQYGGGNTEQYDTGVSYASPVFGPPAPTAAQVAYDTTVTSGSTPNPTYAFQPLSTTTTPSSSFSLPSLSIPGIASPLATPTTLVTTAAPASSLSSYLPYLLLGVGGIAVIAVLKRR